MYRTTRPNAARVIFSCTCYLATRVIFSCMHVLFSLARVIFTCTCIWGRNPQKKLRGVAKLQEKKTRFLTDTFSRSSRTQFVLIYLFLTLDLFKLWFLCNEGLTQTGTSITNSAWRNSTHFNHNHMTFTISRWNEEKVNNKMENIIEKTYCVKYSSWMCMKCTWEKNLWMWDVLHEST